MTITLTREEAQQVLNALGSCGEDWLYDGEDEYPADVYDQEKVEEAFILIKNRLAQQNPIKVLPHEFLKAVQGKENLSGIPVIMSVWPTPIIDFAKENILHDMNKAAEQNGEEL